MTQNRFQPRENGLFSSKNYGAAKRFPDGLHTFARIYF